MKNLNSFLGRATALLAVGALLSLPGSAPAQTYLFTVDSSQSSLTLSGTAFTLPGSGQGASGAVDSWGGTFVASLSGGVWTFVGGWSGITANLNPGAPFSKAPWPIATITTQNYGITESGTVNPYGPVTVNGIYGDLTLDITGGTAQNGSATSGMTMGFTSGKLDWGASGPFLGAGTGGNSSLVGVTGASTSAGLVGWNGSTLTLPILLNTTGSNRTEQWTGQIVGINPVLVPEPSTVALALVGLGLLAGTRRFRRS